MFVLLCVHQKNDVFSISLSFPLSQGNTLSLPNVTSLVDFLTACKKLWLLCFVSLALDSKNPKLYYYCPKPFLLPDHTTWMPSVACPWVFHPWTLRIGWAIRGTRWFRTLLDQRPGKHSPQSDQGCWNGGRPAILKQEKWRPVSRLFALVWIDYKLLIKLIIIANC